MKRRWKERIKNFLRTNFLTRTYFPRWEEKRALRKKKKRRERLQKYGYRLIREVQEELSKSQEVFFFDCGTLLGIIRDGAIIEHDLDMDIGVTIDSAASISRVRECMKKIGCVLYAEDVVDGFGTVQDTFSKYQIHFDVYYYYRRQDKAEQYVLYRDPEKTYSSDCWDVFTSNVGLVIRTILYPLRDFQVSIPENYEQRLVNAYGENWRIPDEDWVYWKGPSVIPTDKKGHIVVRG